MFKYNKEEELARAKQELIISVTDSYSQKRTDLLNALADVTERETWSQQFAEATAFISATDTKRVKVPTPLIDNLIIHRAKSESKEEIAQKIIDKNTAYSAAIGALLGEQKRIIGKMQAAGTMNELNDVINSQRLK